MKVPFRIIRIVAICTVLALPWIIGTVSPDIERRETICPVKRWTGIPCPGCGLTKAIYFGWRGELRKSWDYHPLGLPMLLTGAVLVALTLLDMIRRTDYAGSLLDNALLWQSVCVVFVLYYLAKLVVHLSSC